MLMFKEDGGFHNFNETELEQAKKDGWIDGTTIHKALMDAKNQPIAKPEEVATIPTVAPFHPQAEKPRLGRPPKNVTAAMENDHRNRSNNSR